MKEQKIAQPTQPEPRQSQGLRAWWRRHPRLNALITLAAFLFLLLVVAVISGSGEAIGAVVWLLMIAVGVGFYFLPTIIAAVRKHPQLVPIVIINIITGWILGIGWFVALIWSVANFRHEVSAPPSGVDPVPRIS